MPFTYRPATPATPEALSSPLPISCFKGWDFPRGLHLPFSFVGDENDCLPATVDRVTTQSSRRLHPHNRRPVSHAEPLGTLQGTHPEHLGRKDQGGKAVSLPRVSTAGCSHRPPPTPLVGVEKSLSLPWTISPVVRQDESSSSVQGPWLPPLLCSCSRP